MVRRGSGAYIEEEELQEAEELQLGDQDRHQASPLVPVEALQQRLRLTTSLPALIEYIMQVPLVLVIFNYIRAIIFICIMEKSVLSLLYGPQLPHIQNLSILLVGVGGIGCEVLKCLCKLPVKALHILDLDTIEVHLLLHQISNLNRQFLFQAKHRGQSKALTAR